jgi:hypothetical protein
MIGLRSAVNQGRRGPKVFRGSLEPRDAAIPAESLPDDCLS